MVRGWVGMEKWGNVGLSFEHVVLVLVGLTLSGGWHVVKCFWILKR